MDTLDTKQDRLSALDVTMSQYKSMNDMERGQFLIRTLSASDTNTYEEFKRRIVEFVYFKNLAGSAIKLSSLNRRFHRTAKKHDRTILDTVSELTDDSLIIMDRDKTTALISIKAIEQWHEYIKEMGEARLFLEGFKPSINNWTNGLMEHAE